MTLPSSKAEIKKPNDIDYMYVNWYLDDPSKYAVLNREHKEAVDESFGRLFAPAGIEPELLEIVNQA